MTTATATPTPTATAAAVSASSWARRHWNPLNPNARPFIPGVRVHWTNAALELDGEEFGPPEGSCWCCPGGRCDYSAEHSPVEMVSQEVFSALL